MSTKVVCDFCGRYEPDGTSPVSSGGTFIVQFHLRGKSYPLRWELGPDTHSHPQCLAAEMGRAFHGLKPSWPPAKGESQS